ncbi:hypothetical protein F511_15286 [Dorcoceras hygrometricum]|uniref:Uncharacterized protein n=1 Tax=Dorcoceras hygrometricum TaxID=472368 RepID=A0A2Z7AEA3_9LAMI|nr:hypothetical protein F511_15286 [Dorcoceras hygrometricum]
MRTEATNRDRLLEQSVEMVGKIQCLILLGNKATAKTEKKRGGKPRATRETSLGYEIQLGNLERESEHTHFSSGIPKTSSSIAHLENTLTRTQWKKQNATRDGINQGSKA